MSTTADASVQPTADPRSEGGPGRGRHRGGVPDRAALVLAVVALGASAALGLGLLFMPDGLTSVHGVNPRAAAAWRQGLGLGGPLSPQAFTIWFRVTLVVAWVAHAAALWLVLRGARVPLRTLVKCAAVVVLLLATLAPPALSVDVFAYVGYGRLSVVHGVNPYVGTQADLIRFRDPTAPYLHWPISSPYGPAWTALSSALVTVLPRAAVVAPVLAFKLLAGLALVALAFVLAGAARSRFAGGPDGTALPRRRDATDDVATARDSGAGATLAVVAVLTNPLLLIEGPVNAHNDLSMTVLVAAALVTWQRGRVVRAALWLGAAVAVKFVPLLLLPGMLWARVVGRAPRASREGDDNRDEPHPAPRVSGRPTTLAVATVMTLAALAPLGVFFVPYWHGDATLAGLTSRLDQRPGARPGTKLASPGVSPLSSAPTPATGAAGPRGGFRPTAGRVLFAVAYLVLAWWVARARRLDAGILAAAWVALTLALLVFVLGLWFPWYLVWATGVLALLDRRLRTAGLVFTLPLSLLLMLLYVFPPG